MHMNPNNPTTTHAAKQKSVHLTNLRTPLSVVAFLPSDGSGLVVEGHSACVGVGLRRYGRVAGFKELKLSSPWPTGLTKDGGKC